MFRSSTQLFYILLSFLLPVGLAVAEGHKPSTQSVASGSDEHADSPDKLSIDRLVRSYILNNPTSLILQLDPRIASAEITVANGVLDPIVGLESGLSREASPSSNILGGAGYTESARDFNLYLDKLFSSGTAVRLNYRGGRYANTSPITTLRPEYRSEFGVRFSQQLLNGAFAGSPFWSIRQAELQADATYWSLLNNLIDNIADVIKAYWELVLANKQVEITQRRVDLATWLVNEAKAKVAIGAQPELSYLQAEAELALAEQEQINSRNRSDLLRRQILELQGSANELEMDRTFTLVSVPNIRPVAIDDKSYINAAKEDRPLLRALKLQADVAEISHKRALNSALPKLEIVLDGAVKGLSGEGVPGQESSANYVGGYEDTFDQAADGDYYRAGVGVRLERPFHNSSAKGEEEISQLDLLRARYRLLSAQNRTTAEQLNALSSLKSASQRARLADNSVRAAELGLKTARQRFSLGVATSRDVLDLQSSLITAESEKIRSLVDFEVAAIEIHRVAGSLLDHLGVQVDLGIPENNSLQ